MRGHTVTRKIRLYGNRRLGLSCSFLQAYNRDTSARLYERESFNPCLQCLSQPVPVSQQQKSPSRNHKGHVMGLRSQPSGTGERWGLPSLCDI